MRFAIIGFKLGCDGSRNYFPMPEVRIPNLFLIGAPKCGTTALSHYLADHPKIYMSEQSGIKEPGYFAYDAHSVFGGRRVKSQDAYFDLFKPAPPDIRYVGEASVVYWESKTAVPEILKISPQALFVVMIRNPIEIAQGMHNQRVRERSENLIAFESAWRNQKKRMHGVLLPAAIRDPRALQYGELARVGTRLAGLFRMVRKERIHVILYDDFSQNPERSYKNLLHFLGLEYVGRKKFLIANQSRHYHVPALQQELRRLEQLRKRIGIPGGWGVQKLVDLYNIRSGAAPLKPELYAEMREYFKPEVALLSHLLDRDLMHWVE